MNEYALIKNGVVQTTKYFEQRPANIAHKGLFWVPVEVEIDEFDSRNQMLGPEQIIIEQNRVVRKRQMVSIPREEMIKKIVLERKRRLEQGFNFSFGDSRGVHHIGTTEDDMKGWEEVTTAATSFNALGMGTQQLNIVTNTGPVTITASEWLQILIAATIHRQPIWAASFILQSMPEIPADYTNNNWWNLNA